MYISGEPSPTTRWPTTGYQGGVLDEPAKPTTGRSPAVVGAAVLAMAFLVGTGGVIDARYLQNRHERGYAFAGVRVPGESPNPARTPAENLARTRTVLKPAVSDLAELLGVSRQAVYSWANGEQPKAELAARLEDLAQAADVIAAENTNPGLALKRKIADGKNLVEIVAAGGSARDAAHRLARILRREDDQRKRLAAKLAGRVSTPLEIDEYGSPILREEFF